MTPAVPSLRLIVSILSVGNFIIGMGAFMLIGLLNPLADDLGITRAAAGQMMTVYALGYAVLSPLLVALSGQMGRRRLLFLAVLTFAASCLMAALAPNPGVLYASRILAAAGAGIVTPVAAAVAAGLSPPERQARALASVFFGLTLAQVLGVPLGGFVAYTFGWRSAFWLVAILCLPVAALVWRYLPVGLSFAPVSLGDLGRTLRHPLRMLSVSFTALLMGAMYVVYTYVSPLLADTMGFGRNGITATLLAFGLGAVVGNLAGGQVTDRIGPLRTLIILSIAQIIIMPIYSALPLPVSAVMGLSVLWALFGWSFMAAQQVRLISLDPASAPVLLALNAAAIYVGAAIGSSIGAAVITTWGLTGLGIAGGATALAALVLLLITDLGVRRSPR